MYHKIRITVVSLMAIAICMLSSTGTLSYFTDTDSKQNDFTVGNVSTVLAIYDDLAGDKRVFDAANYSPLKDNVDIPFYLQAMNDGNVPVYQRFRVVIPIALAQVVTLDLPCTIAEAPTHAGSCSSTDYNVSYSLDDMYAKYYIVSNAAVAVDDVTNEWPTTKIHIRGLSDENKSLFTCENNDPNHCVLGIGVYSDSIQTTGFTSAIQAFENLTEKY